MTYTADPVAEELQLLRQLVRCPITIRHSGTRAVANRLVFSGLAMVWYDADGATWVEITKPGMDRLGRRGDWMQTFTGRKFWPMDPDPAAIDIEDVAHALSNACRYAGHTTRFYSVAEHCVLLARHVAPPFRKWALLHDASEAYLVDVPRPVKRFLGGYREAEARLMLAVAERFGLASEIPAEVHDADNRILLDERAQAMVKTDDDWNIAGGPLGVALRFWSPEVARLMFMSTFERLFAEARP